MDDTLLLYRNAKVGDTSAYDYSAKVFLSGYYHRSQNTANYMISIGMQNGDKAIAKSGSAPNAYYVLITLDSTDAQGCTQVSLPPNKVVYCEADSCFYRIISSTIDNTTVFMHEIYQPYVPFNYHNTSEQIALKDFTYTAERMGKTPTLTADFYDKECYDNIWDNDTTDPKYRFYDIFTVFRGERYYFKLTPQSQLQNTDARYKHTINFVSEREKLEHAKMFDVVTTTTPDAPVSDSSKFVFYGTLSEFADRINASLIKEGVTFSTTYNGITIFSGYHVEIKIKDGNNGGIDSSMLTKAATVSIENNSILEALGHLDTDYGVSYYVDGYTIWIADFEADLTGEGHPAIQYGEENSLLQITRQNVTKNIVTRITGYGSDDNIPYYYPNPCESGFLQAIYDQRSGSSGVVKHPYEWAKISNVLTKATPLLSITNEPIYPNKGDKYYNSSDKKIYNYNGTAWVDTGYAEYGITYTHGGKIYMRRGINDTSYYRTLVDRTGDYDLFLKNTKADVFEYGVPYIVDGIVSDETYTDGTQKYKLITYEFQPESSMELFAYFKQARFTTGAGSSIYSHNSTTNNAQTELFALHDIRFSGSFIKLIIRQNIGYDFRNAYRYEGRTYHIATHYVMFGDAEEYNATWPENWFYGEGSLVRRVRLDRSWLVGDETWAESLGEPNTWGERPWSATYVYPQYYEYTTWDYTQKDKGYYKITHNEITKKTPIEPTNGFQLRDIRTGKLYRGNGSRFVDTGITVDASTPQSVTNIPPLYIYRKVWYRNERRPTKAFIGENLSNYGLYVTGTPIKGDKITFDTAYYMQPQQYLMPSIYYKSNGAKRFFDAIAYPYSKVRGKNVDYDIGEYMRHFINPAGYHVTNENYESDHDTGTCYAFENIIDKGHPRTHIEPISDIKPSIEGLTTTIGVQTIPVDVFEGFCYDYSDCDDTWDAYERESNDGSNVNLKHPHFFAKLRPLGFNIFAMAIDENEMVVNFTSGCCMACSFKVKVGKDSLQNVIALYENNIYRYDDDGNIDTSTPWAAAGTPMRYSDRQLYILNGNNLVEFGRADEFMPPTNEDNDDDGTKYDGDVITSEVRMNNVQASQKDTTSNYVWIALEKDVSTFSYPMPSVSNNMKPIATTDKFVFTHIKMPLRFVRAAEERLSKALVEYMSANNAELFHYSIKFSRIFLEESGNTYAADLNENVKLHILYANHENKSFYVKSYTYKKVGGEPLPEISIELRENINVARYRYTNRIEFDMGDGWNIIRSAEDIIRTIRGTGNGNGSSLVNRDMVSMLSRHLVSRNGSTMRGTLRTTNTSRIIGNVDIIRENGQQVSVRDIDNILGIDDNSGVRGRARNLLIDLGIEAFDETKNYDVDEMCVYEGRLMRFTQKKNAGVWDTSKAANDSVANCLFRALGVQEYDEQRTTPYTKGAKFFRNSKIYKVDTEFTPMVSGTPVSETVFTRSATQLEIVEAFAGADATATLQADVERLSKSVNNLNSQVLDENSGLAAVVNNVNNAVNALATALRTDNVGSTATQTAASGVNTAIEGANVDDVYNKMLTFIAKSIWGQLVDDIHSEAGDADSDYSITNKLYGQSQNTGGIPVEFSKDDAYPNGQFVIRNKDLYSLKSGKNSGEDWGDIDQSTIIDRNDILKKLVIFSTDEYDVTPSSIFLSYGLYVMASTLCDYMLKFVSDNGDNGLVYAKLAETITSMTKEYIDGSSKNMFTEHIPTTPVGTAYTVLQYAVMKLELDGKLYAASMYDKELNKDDDHHILFAIEPMNKMVKDFLEFMGKCSTKEVVIGGETVLCYYADNATIADKFGYNYLYSADYLVENGTMYFDSDAKEYYLPTE